MKKTFGVVRLALITGAMIVGCIAFSAQEAVIADNEHTCTRKHTYSEVEQGHLCTLVSGTYTFVKNN